MALMPPPAPCPPLWLDGLDALAAQAIGLSDPNPRVACRIVTRSAQVFEGHTQPAGGPHAEVMALRAAQAAGADLTQACALVTLEPCSHHGRTPPCCDALIAAGVGHIVVAIIDPNPRVAGQGLARLRAAGVRVDLLDPAHPLAVASRALNVGFFSRMERGRPWVRLKIAASLDGTTALTNGASQWITGAAARTDGHAWRKRAGAILTGMGTVQRDDPRLDVRLVHTTHQPLRVVLDTQLRLAPTARILQPPGHVLVYHAPGPDAPQPPAGSPPLQARRAALLATGAELIACASAPHSTDSPTQLDLGAVLLDMARREINELHVEAGHRLNGALLQAGLVDELLLYLAPKLLGPGLGLAHIGPYTALEQGLTLTYTDITPVGHDLRLRARVLAPQLPA